MYFKFAFICLWFLISIFDPSIALFQDIELPRNFRALYRWTTSSILCRVLDRVNYSNNSRNVLFFDLDQRGLLQ